MLQKKKCSWFLEEVQLEIEMVKTIQKMIVRAFQSHILVRLLVVILEAPGGCICWD
jgi:hypothetical protein